MWNRRKGEHRRGEGGRDPNTSRNGLTAISEARKLYKIGKVTADELRQLEENDAKFREDEASSELEAFSPKSPATSVANAEPCNTPKATSAAPNSAIISSAAAAAAASSSPLPSPSSPTLSPTSYWVNSRRRSTGNGGKPRRSQSVGATSLPQRKKEPTSVFTAADNDPSSINYPVTADVSPSSRSSVIASSPPATTTGGGGHPKRGRAWIGTGGWDQMSATMMQLFGGDKERQGWVMKATAPHPGGLPKQKHLRNVVLALWDESLTTPALWSALSGRPWRTQPVVALKVLAVVLKLVQQGPPSVRRTAGIPEHAAFLLDVATTWEQRASMLAEATSTTTKTAKTATPAATVAQITKTTKTTKANNNGPIHVSSIVATAGRISPKLFERGNSGGNGSALFSKKQQQQQQQRLKFGGSGGCGVKRRSVSSDGWIGCGGWGVLEEEGEGGGGKGGGHLTNEDDEDAYHQSQQTERQGFGNSKGLAATMTTTASLSTFSSISTSSSSGDDLVSLDSSSGGGGGGISRAFSCGGRSSGRNGGRSGARSPLASVDSIEDYAEDFEQDTNNHEPVVEPLRQNKPSFFTSLPPPSLLVDQTSMLPLPRTISSSPSVTASPTSSSNTISSPSAPELLAETPGSPTTTPTTRGGASTSSVERSVAVATLVASFARAVHDRCILHGRFSLPFEKALADAETAFNGPGNSSDQGTHSDGSSEGGGSKSDFETVSRKKTTQEEGDDDDDDMDLGHEAELLDMASAMVSVQSKLVEVLHLALALHKVGSGGSGRTFTLLERKDGNHEVHKERRLDEEVGDNMTKVGGLPFDVVTAPEPALGFSPPASVIKTSPLLSLEISQQPKTAGKDPAKNDDDGKGVDEKVGGNGDGHENGEDSDATNNDDPRSVTAAWLVLPLLEEVYSLFVASTLTTSRCLKTRHKRRQRRHQQHGDEKLPSTSSSSSSSSSLVSPPLAMTSSALTSVLATAATTQRAALEAQVEATAFGAYESYLNCLPRLIPVVTSASRRHHIRLMLGAWTPTLPQPTISFASKSAALNTFLDPVVINDGLDATADFSPKAMRTPHFHPGLPVAPDGTLLWGPAINSRLFLAPVKAASATSNSATTVTSPTSSTLSTNFDSFNAAALGTDESCSSSWDTEGLAPLAAASAIVYEAGGSGFADNNNENTATTILNEKMAERRISQGAPSTSSHLIRAPSKTDSPTAVGEFISVSHEGGGQKKDGIASKVQSACGASKINVDGVSSLSGTASLVSTSSSSSTTTTTSSPYLLRPPPSPFKAFAARATDVFIPNLFPTSDTPTMLKNSKSRKPKATATNSSIKSNASRSTMREASTVSGGNENDGARLACAGTVRRSHVHSDGDNSDNDGGNDDSGFKINPLRSNNTAATTTETSFDPFSSSTNPIRWSRDSSSSQTRSSTLSTTVTEESPLVALAAVIVGDGPVSPTVFDILGQDGGANKANSNFNNDVTEPSGIPSFQPRLLQKPSLKNVLSGGGGNGADPSTITSTSPLGLLQKPAAMSQLPESTTNISDGRDNSCSGISLSTRSSFVSSPRPRLLPKPSLLDVMSDSSAGSGGGIGDEDYSPSLQSFQIPPQILTPTDTPPLPQLVPATQLHAHSLPPQALPPQSPPLSPPQSPPSYLPWEHVAYEGWRQQDGSVNSHSVVGLSPEGRRALDACVSDFREWTFQTHNNGDSFDGSNDNDKGARGGGHADDVTDPGGDTDYGIGVNITPKTSQPLKVSPSLLRCLREVGSGGCAAVYLAHQAVPEAVYRACHAPVGDDGEVGDGPVVVGRGGGFVIREVALKKMVIPPGTPHLVAKRAIQDFHAEAKMLFKLRFHSTTPPQAAGGHRRDGGNDGEAGGGGASTATGRSEQVLKQTRSTGGGGAGHPCIAALLGVVEEPLGILTDFCSNGNLMEALADHPEKFDWPTVHRVASQVASGCAFLHAQRPPVLHRDLKSLNILLDRNWDAKVTDFGLSRSASGADSVCGASSWVERMTAMCGTYHWMAPEVMTSTPPPPQQQPQHQKQRQGGSTGTEAAAATVGASEDDAASPGGGGRGGSIYGPPVDVFSFAIVLWELSTRQVPYEGWAAPQVIVAVAHRGERLPLPRPSAKHTANNGVMPEANEGKYFVSENQTRVQAEMCDGNEEECVCPAQFLQLISECWAQDPNSRPRFSEVEEALFRMQP